MQDEMQITQVGAGLIGSLLSLCLAKRGYNVDIYEKRPDMRKEAISAGRSINLAISYRGFYALSQVGLEKEAMDISIPMPGRMVHLLSGEQYFQPYGKNEKECIYSISRGDLNKLLMNHAQATGRVQMHFLHHLEEVDFENRKLKFKVGRATDLSAEEIMNLPYQRLIGTDGSGSALRNAMERINVLTPADSCHEDYLAHGYKELLLPPGPGGKYQLNKNALHIWPRVSFMLIALPNLDGSFTCTLFLPLQGELSFQQLSSVEQIQGFFQKHFPDFFELMPDVPQDFLKNPVGQMVTVRTKRWNYKSNVLLLGDAAHAIVPFFGQGMNCGFEDCTFFSDMLDRNANVPPEDSWDAIIEDFGTLRKPDTDAIADMALGNFIEMRDKVNDPQFLFEKRVEKKLRELFPEDYIPRYSLVSFSRIPYRVAKQAGLIQDQILKDLCNGISTIDDLDLLRATEQVTRKLKSLGSMSKF